MPFDNECKNPHLGCITGYGRSHSDIRRLRIGGMDLDREEMNHVSCPCSHFDHCGSPCRPRLDRVHTAVLPSSCSPASDAAGSLRADVEGAVELGPVGQG